MTVIYDQHGAIVELHIDGIVYTPETLRRALDRPCVLCFIWHTLIGPLMYGLFYSWRKRR